MRCTRWLIGCWLLGVAAAPLQADEAHTPEAILELPLDQLLTLKISSTTKTAIDLRQAPATVSVITRQDLDRYPWRSVADALRLQAGVDVLDDQTLANVGMRGLAGGYAAQGQSIKAMIDGQDLAFRTTSTNFLGPEFIPRLAIERIEIIRGPLSTLYGADAFAGVINVIPRQSAKPTVEFQQDVIDRRDRFGWQTQLVGWSAQPGLRFMGALAVENGDRPGLLLPPSSPRYAALHARAGAQSHDDKDQSLSAYFNLTSEDGYGRLTLDYSHQALRRGANFFPESEPLTDAVVSFQQDMARLRWHYDWSDSLNTRASIAHQAGDSGSDTRLHDPFRITVDSLYRDYGNQQTTTSAEVEYHPGDWSLLAGADYNYDREDLPTLILVFRDGQQERHNAGRRIRVDNLGLYLQWLAPLSPRVQLNAGYRRDDHSLYQQQDSYRAGLVVNASARTTLRLLAGSAFKAPALTQLFGGEHPRLFGPAPNRALKPQQAVTVEASLSHRLRASLQGNATVYRTRIRDYAEYDTIAANPQAHNRGRITATGLELELRYQTPRPGLDAFVNAAWVHTERSADTSVGFEVSERTRGYPARTLGAGIAQSLARWPLSWSLTALAVGPRLADNSNLPFLPLGAQREYALPGYTLFDASLRTERWRLLAGRRTEWSLALQNLTDKRYAEPGFSGIDVPGAGRRWWLSLRQEF